jgi:hypothetical protein
VAHSLQSASLGSAPRRTAEGTSMMDRHAPLWFLIRLISPLALYSTIEWRGASSPAAGIEAAMDAGGGGRDDGKADGEAHVRHQA